METVCWIFFRASSFLWKERNYAFVQFLCEKYSSRHQDCRNRGDYKTDSILKYFNPLSCKMQGIKIKWFMYVFFEFVYYRSGICTTERWLLSYLISKVVNWLELQTFITRRVEKSVYFLPTGKMFTLKTYSCIFCWLFLLHKMIMSSFFKMFLYFKIFIYL